MPDEILWIHLEQIWEIETREDFDLQLRLKKCSKLGMLSGCQTAPRNILYDQLCAYVVHYHSLYAANYRWGGRFILGFQMIQLMALFKHICNYWWNIWNQTAMPNTHERQGWFLGLWLLDFAWWQVGYTVVWISRQLQGAGTKPKKMSLLMALKFLKFFIM